MKYLASLVAVSAAALVISGGAHAHSHKAKDSMHSGDTITGVKVENAWARATPGKARNGAAYVKIVKTGKDGDRLIGAKGDVAKRVEIHTHLMDNGIMRMRKVDGVDLPPGEAVTFKPGGHHVMLIGLHAPLKKGQTFPVTLLFEKAGEIETMVRIMGVGAMKGGLGHDMNKNMKPGHRGH